MLRMRNARLSACHSASRMRQLRAGAEGNAGFRKRHQFRFFPEDGEDSLLLQCALESVEAVLTDEPGDFNMPQYCS